MNEFIIGVIVSSVVWVFIIRGIKRWEDSLHPETKKRKVEDIKQNKFYITAGQLRTLMLNTKSQSIFELLNRIEGQELEHRDINQRRI